VTDSHRLLEDLQSEVDALQDDLRDRAAHVPEFDTALRAEYASAVRAHRTADTFETWREEPVTQAAVGWVLGTVFVRFLEDNGLVEPRLSGLDDRRRLALDRHAAYFEQHPLETDREYLLDVFREMGELPALGELFDRRHNPLWRLMPSGDGAKRLLDFWQRIEPATGTIAHDLQDPAWDTRILGDLYQDLSESARKRYALLQTPRFVEAFILDRTLTPAVETFGYREATLIDPTCGSGHFLLGAFERLLALYGANEPAVNAQTRVQRVLAQIAGVDLNPFATAIARFRLLLASLSACGITRLADAPGFDINVATGDSLLHGSRFSDTGRGMQLALDPDDPSHHHFFAEDERVDRLLGRQYHAVVGNPPYIVVRDKALNALYRQRYASCHRQYSLVAPFTERFFELAYRGDESTQAGYVGMIVANSFMKREFGSRLIEDFLPRVDLTHAIDTSGAYIPGHGTPTVILFGRNRRQGDVTRTVMGIRGEPSTPEDPSRGQVWSSILAQVDVVGSESAFVSVRDLAQDDLHHHPWSIGGGGASELKSALERRSVRRLAAVAELPIGRAARTGEDDAFIIPRYTAARHSALEGNILTGVVGGDGVRDWRIDTDTLILFPYDPRAGLTRLADTDSRTKLIKESLWPLRTLLAGRNTFEGDMAAAGRAWWEFQQYTASANITPLSITFPLIATHNHFVLDRGGKVFRQSALVIKLAANATEADHYELLAVLNSSAACFWMKQVFFPKGGDHVGQEGARVRRTWWDERYEFAGTGLESFPLVTFSDIESAKSLEAAASGITFPSQLKHFEPQLLSSLRQSAASALAESILRQEELDWTVYAAYGLCSEGFCGSDHWPSGIALGERAFEIVMARRMAAGDLETTWFERHGSDPITELPSHWPGDYKQLVERRIALIENDRNIGLIEQPEYKRRWNVEPWESQQAGALRERLLERLESDHYWRDPQVTTVARLADKARADTDFMQAAEAYRGRPDFDVTALVTELVESESVPYLPVLRYTESGLRKRAQWERTWDLQRQEDAIDARAELVDDDPRKLSPEQAKAEKARQVGDVPVPPKYASADFRTSDYWRFRGKLDVPKERFITFPGAERSVDPTLVVAWVGWDHLQQAQALANYIVRAQDEEGWLADRLIPLLAGLLELVPWLKQWHNDFDPQFQLRMGDYFADFVQERARGLGVTLDDLRGWKPADQTPGRRPRAKSRSAAQLPSPSRSDEGWRTI
jgi:hypothetical protein